MFRDNATRENVACDNSEGGCSAIPLVGFAGGQIAMPAVMANTALLTYWTSNTEGGTYQALHDANDAAITQAVTAAKNYPIKDEAFGARYLKLVTDHADGATIEIALTA